MIKTLGLAGLASQLPKFSFAADMGSKRIKVGLIGCSNRGLQAVENMICASGKDVQICAIGDLFEDRLKGGANRIEGLKKKYGERFGADIVDLPASRQFAGWDAYKQVIAENVDVIIHATPPAFRPMHLKACIEANKHVFAEKPACVDVAGARLLKEISKEASKRRLSIIPGVQRRYHCGYMEAAKRVQDGQIGEIISAQCFWLNSRFFIQNFDHKIADPYEMEYQVRNWFIFRWLSGDSYVEQHVHNIDVISWIMGRNPKEVVGNGGRALDIPFPEMGDRFSHFAVDYDYGKGVHCASYSRRENKTADYVLERIIGTKGVLETSMGGQQITGENPWKADGKYPQCLEEEHRILIDSVKNNEPVNMLDAMTDSTLMAIAGRESAYTGFKFKFDWIAERSKNSWLPEKLEFGKHENIFVPIPGKYKLE